jgi:hypothetical protein
MEKQKYVKPSAVSLDQVSSAIGATCTFTGSNGASLLACLNGPIANTSCRAGGIAGDPELGGSCNSNGSTALYGQCKTVGSVAAF